MRIRAILVMVGLLVHVALLCFARPPGANVFRELQFVFSHRSLSYDEKMAIKHPDEYPKIRFIAAHTDSQATVLLPAALNQGDFTRALAYPRIIDSQRQESFWGPTPPGTYALVEGPWPESVPEAVRRTSRVVAAEGMLTLIVRTSDGTQP